MFSQIIKYCAAILVSIFLLGCGYTQLKEIEMKYIPVFHIEGVDIRNERLSPIEVFEDTNKIIDKFIIIGTTSASEEYYPEDGKQDKRLYDKLVQNASSTDADAVSNLKYDYRTAIVMDGPSNESREISALLIKCVKNIEITDHVYLKFDLNEPASITVILYDLKGIFVAKPFDAHKQYAEWGPLIYRKKDLPNGYYKLYTKGVHYYNDRILWEKSKWIQIVNQNE
jgi:hypothetical protein